VQLCPVGLISLGGVEEYANRGQDISISTKQAGGKIDPIYSDQKVAKETLNPPVYQP